MRSKTHLSLWQFAEWLGFDGWHFNGINKNNTLSAAKPSGMCECILYRGVGGKWGRKDFVDLIKQAERLFISETGAFPSPTQILNEEIKISTPMVNPYYGQFKSYEVDYGCYLIDVGIKTLEYIGIFSLVKTSGMTLLDEFTCSFPVPPSLNPQDIRVYFTNADGGYIDDPTFEDREFEIRPIVKISINRTTSIATIKAPSFLFRKPESDDSSLCMPNISSTYVDEVSIYYEALNQITGQGFLQFAKGCCVQNDNYQLASSFLVKSIGDSYGLAPIPATYDGDTYTYYDLCTNPRYAYVNYLSGFSFDKYNLINNDAFESIAKLTIGLAEFSKEFCVCDESASKKFQFYRSVQKEKVAEGSSEGGIGDQYAILTTKKSVEALNGLPPNNGVLQAMRLIETLKCGAVEGMQI